MRLQSRLAHPYHFAVRSAGNHQRVALVIRVMSPNSEVCVSLEEQHVALPKLYGAPAYARPPKVAPAVERPFDPDEMPIEAYQTEEEREFASELPPRAYAAGGVHLGRIGQQETTTSGSLRPHAFRLRAIAGKLLGGD
jgi:hypothetical protein